MKWFKHYNTASQGNSLKLLWAENDMETYGFWWRLLELISLWEKPEDRGSIILSYPLLKRELGWNRQRSSKVLSKIGQTFNICIEPISGGETFKVSVPNWLEFQENRGSKTFEKKVKKATDIRSKNKEERIKNKEPEKPRFDFELVYKAYPRKLGKTNGLKICAKQIKTQQDFDDLRRAVTNYALFTNDSDPKFIKHFSSFMSVWRDYIHPLVIEKFNPDAALNAFIDRTPPRPGLT